MYKFAARRVGSRRNLARIGQPDRKSVELRKAIPARSSSQHVSGVAQFTAPNPILVDRQASMTSPKAAKPKLRWYQVRLRTLILVTLLLGATLGLNAPVIKVLARNLFIREAPPPAKAARTADESAGQADSSNLQVIVKLRSSTNIHPEIEKFYKSQSSPSDEVERGMQLEAIEHNARMNALR